MSYKARVTRTAQEILKCRVKDLSGPKTKIVAMPLETYARLRKELKIEVLTVIQKGRAADYAKIRLKLASDHGIPMDPKAPKPRVAVVKPPSVAATPIEIPDPPAQVKEKQEGETDKQFRSRRMKEGQTLRRWREKYAEAHAGAGTTESVPESKAAGGRPEGEAETFSFDPNGTSGDEAAGGEAFDPIKEQIEVASMEALLNR